MLPICRSWLQDLELVKSFYGMLCIALQNVPEVIIRTHGLGKSHKKERSLHHFANGIMAKLG